VATTTPARLGAPSFLADFDDPAVQLAVFMSRDYLEATTELPAVTAEDLHARFFWYRYRREDRHR
jgi:hypothetical protein